MKTLYSLAVLLILSVSSSTLFAAEGTKGFTIMRLDNGLTVLVTENKALPVVSVQVWVRVGSINETAATRGLSHFLEHLIFKGTKRYPGDEISRRVENNGGMINAGTSKEFTQFYIDSQKNGFEDAVRMLADAMANAAMPDDEINRERPVVIEEIKRAADNPSSELYNSFSSALFPTTPYHYNVIGSSTVIRTVRRNDILDCYHHHYVPANMIVSIGGDVDTPAALALIRETFGAQKNHPAPAHPAVIEPPHAAVTVKTTKQVEQLYWLGGFTGPDCGAPLLYAADIVSTILGGGRSSRLNRVLREDKQLVYGIGSSFWPQGGTGVFSISAVCSAENVTKVPTEITRELDLFLANGPTDAELTRAKEMTRSQWYFDQETAHDQAATAGYWHLMGYPSMPDTYIENINKVTAGDVTDFLKMYYQPQGLTSAVLIPEKK
ncbi:MAG: pitrilysin family protein [Elusimicrobiota bacterium]